MSRKTKNIVLIVFAAWALFYGCSFQQKEEQSSEAEASMDTVAIASDSIDQFSGLVVDEELPLVVANCTPCHSAKLIAQNQATREGWKHMVIWMQETQNLWDLGANEDKILDYLARHYAPEQTGRRKNLETIDWYDLKENESEN